MSDKIHATTILCVRKNGSLVMLSDGQVTSGNVVLKDSAKKVRTLCDGKVLVGFAGSVADAMTLVDLLEKKLHAHSGQLLRAVIEMCKDWRTDKYLHRLEASMIVADKDVILNVGGSGDVIECDHIAAVGSGGNYALAAAKALVALDLTAIDIARRSMTIAADLCVYTNNNFTIVTLEVS